MSTLAKIKFSYDVTLSVEQQNRLKELAFVADFSISENHEYRWSTISMLIEDAMMFGKFEVIQILQYHILDKISSFQQREMSNLNQKCNVMVNGLGTLAIDEVKACLDFCTDALNEELKNGWRIVAICVQPDQRRPDYILGRTIKG